MERLNLAVGLCSLVVLFGSILLDELFQECEGDCIPLVLSREELGVLPI